MTFSKFSHQPLDHKTEIPEELYIFSVDPKVFDNIVVDPYSLKLESKGAEGQRYADVFFIDEDEKTVYLYYYPSFIGYDPKEADDTRERRIRELKEKQKYNPEDRVESIITRPGSVHQDAKDAVAYRFYKNGNPYIPHLKSSKYGGLSHTKVSDNLSNEMSRSTRNFTFQDVNDLAEICFHFDFDQKDFERPKQTLIINIQRSIEHNAFKKIVLARQKARLAENGLEDLPETDKEVNKIVDKSINENSFADIYTTKWKEINKDKQKIANEIMRTIYFASGLSPITEAHDIRAHPPDHELIEKALNVAKKYHITLNLNYIPSTATAGNITKRTALMESVIKNDKKSVELLLDFDKKSIINQKDAKGDTALVLALMEANLDLAKVLIKNGATLQEDLVLDITDDYDIKIKSWIIKNKPEFITKLMSDLDTMIDKSDYIAVGLFLKKYAYLEPLNMIDNPDGETFKSKLANSFQGMASDCSFEKLKQFQSSISMVDFKEIVNSTNYNKKTPLILASGPVSSTEQFQTLSWLLTQGANLSLQDDEGKTALMHAVSPDIFTTNRNKNVADLFLKESKYILNMKDHFGNTALIYSLNNEDLEIFNYLLKEHQAIVDYDQILKFSLDEDQDYEGILKKLIANDHLNITSYMLLHSDREFKADIPSHKIEKLIEQAIITINESPMTDSEKLQLFYNVLDKKNSLGKFISNADKKPESDLLALSILKKDKKDYFIEIRSAISNLETIMEQKKPRGKIDM